MYLMFMEIPVDAYPDVRSRSRTDLTRDLMDSRILPVIDNPLWQLLQP